MAVCKYPISAESVADASAKDVSPTWAYCGALLIQHGTDEPMGRRTERSNGLGCRFGGVEENDRGPT